MITVDNNQPGKNFIKTKGFTSKKDRSRWFEAHRAVLNLPEEIDPDEWAAQKRELEEAA